jgi:hypothetical protein
VLGLHARIEAFRQGKLSETNNPEIPFFLCSTRLHLAKECNQLISDIERQLDPEKPKIIVIDTLNRSIGGSENDAEDMGNFVAACDRLREKFGCTVIVIHHSGYEAGHPRGHTSLVGAVDAQLKVTKNDAGNVQVILEQMKDGPAGITLESRLKVLELAFDDNGDMITSCIIEPAEPDPTPSAQPSPTHPGKAKPKLSDKDQIALNTLERAIIAHGKVAPGHNYIPAAAKVVNVDLWRRFYFQGTSHDDDLSKDARRKAWLRSRHSLVAKRVVTIIDEMVWIS